MTGVLIKDRQKWIQRQDCWTHKPKRRPWETWTARPFSWTSNLQTHQGVSLCCLNPIHGGLLHSRGPAQSLSTFVKGYTILGARNHLKTTFPMQSPGLQKSGRLHAPTLHLQSRTADASGEVRAKDREQVPGCGQAQQMTHLEWRKETGGNRHSVFYGLTGKINSDWVLSKHPHGLRPGGRTINKAHW